MSSLSFSQTTINQKREQQPNGFVAPQNSKNLAGHFGHDKYRRICGDRRHYGGRSASKGRPSHACGQENEEHSSLRLVVLLLLSGLLLPKRTMQKSALLAALRSKIHRHGFSHFVDDPPSVAQDGNAIVVPGCPTCRKRFGTVQKNGFEFPPDPTICSPGYGLS